MFTKNTWGGDKLYLFIYFLFAEIPFLF